MSRPNTYSVGCIEPGCHEQTFRERRSRREERRDGPLPDWRCRKHSAPAEWLSPTNLTRVTRLVARPLEMTMFRGDVGNIQNGDGGDALFWVREGATTGSGYAFGPGFSANTKEFPAGTVLEVTVRAILPEPQPTMTCPQCKAELPDFDGFGVLAHTKPAFADGCGYCTHPSRDKTEAGWVCGICGNVTL